MKIFLIHGDDELKSYERLQKFIETAKARSWEVNYLDESNFSFLESLRSRSLFEGEKFFVLKDIKKIGKKESDWLSKNSEKAEGNLIIYHPSVASATFLNGLPKFTKVEEFKLPKLIFQFLDSFVPKNAKASINLLHQVAVNQPPEFIFSLFARHIRDLYWVKITESPPPGQTSGSENLPVRRSPSGAVPYPNWRVGKLKAQAGEFNINQLRQLIGELAKIDIEAKTSNAEMIPSLDLLLATRLE